MSALPALASEDLVPLNGVQDNGECRKGGGAGGHPTAAWSRAGSVSSSSDIDSSRQSPGDHNVAQIMDSEVDFGDILDAPEEAQPATKLSLKPRAKPRKTTLQSKSSAPNPALNIRDGDPGAVTQGNSSEELSKSHGTASLACPGSETVDDIAGSQGTLDTPSEDVLRVPSGPLNNCGAVSGDATCGVSAAGSVSQDDGRFDDSSKLSTHHERSVVSDIHASTASSCGKNIDDIVHSGETLDAQAKEETVSKLQQKDSGCHGSGGHASDSEALPRAEPKGKGKSVSFVLPDASDGAAPRQTNSVIDDFDSFFDDLYNMPQKTAQKEHTNKYPQGKPSDRAVEQQPKSNVGEIGSSMTLRSRKNVQKVGISQHTVEGYFDEDFVEPSTSEQDNDNSVDYTAGSKRKIKRNSRDCVEEQQQEGVQNDKGQISSRGRKKISKAAPTKKTEKKLTHRIRQKRMKEVKTLLETPYEMIDHKKLSAAHLRLLQEARERNNVKETLPGPSSNTSFQHENPDDFDYSRYNEAENFDEDRIETDGTNATKLNYHSYMKKQTRSKWSKSETDLFYQGLRQFGSDFAMIQQLFPDKTRHHVRQKFKAEEKKNPMLIHDAIIHRSGDNLYFKKVIQQLNIEDVIPDVSTTCKQDGVSNEGGTTNENASDGFNEEENSSNQLDKEQDVHMSDGQEEEHVRGNSDDDLGDIFDWY